MEGYSMCKHIRHRTAIQKPEHSDVLAYYDGMNETIIINLSASETAKIIILLPGRLR